ncbi:MAG: hypothetical protein IIC88_00090 [Chloroflexi bacterium]|nr:hypothetical protein [Chloroflexota bacterium]
MKVELDIDEAWDLMSLVVARLAKDASLSDSDRAKVRRWRSNTMRPEGEAMRLLTGKLNEDLAAAMERKKRSQIRKPDWR